MFCSLIIYIIFATMKANEKELTKIAEEYNISGMKLFTEVSTAKSMKPNELRIGNWVSHIPSQNKTADGNFIVSEINLFDANTINGLDSDDCQPIPLTEEWLLKFGFEKRVTIEHSVQYFIGINPITRDWLFDIMWLEGYEYPFYINGHFQVKYVHQLQNLFFALTGEELKFNKL